ncbi:MAG: hemerythrin domain-containing protein [Maricaulaceae bacterium]|jgi:hypothetical protein
MPDVTKELFDAFQKDHATLGRGLHQIGSRLRGGDMAGARDAADELDRAAGAHIAFEEHDFYPALAPFLDDDEISQLYREHRDGQATVKDLMGLDPAASIDKQRREGLLEHVEAMERHVSECGELFGAMGGLDSDAQAALLEKLDTWRAKAPRWTEITQTRD